MEMKTIKSLRLAAKMTQSEVADRLGISLRNIQQKESGERGTDVDLYFKILEITGHDFKITKKKQKK